MRRVGIGNLGRRYQSFKDVAIEIDELREDLKQSTELAGCNSRSC